MSTIAGCIALLIVFWLLVFGLAAVLGRMNGGDE